MKELKSSSLTSTTRPPATITVNLISSLKSLKKASLITLGTSCLIDKLASLTNKKACTEPTVWIA
jgi:hypothetical protein